MPGALTKSIGWFIPSFLTGAIVGLLLTANMSFAADPRYDTSQTDIDYGQQFQKIIDQLRSKHVNPDAVKSEAELFRIAIDAIMREIGDKHGRYFSSEGFKQFQEEFKPANYTGVGIKIAPASGGIIILQFFEDSPLKNMNIKIGDIITAAGSLGEPMTEWTVVERQGNIKEMVGAIKGPSGTDVNLKIKRGGTDLGVITVSRIQTRNQHVFMKLNRDILTIRVEQFSADIYDDIMGMLDTRGWLDNDDVLDTSVISGLVFDLRGNPGGSLSQSVRVSDLFLPAESIAVSVVSRPDGEGEKPSAVLLMTEDDRTFPITIPRVVLVNGMSASASEIVAGAVKAETIIMGVKTYGKGSVQTIIPLPGGSAIKTTTAIYYAAGDIAIDGVGLEPDSPVQQPNTVGLSEDDRRMNGYLIKVSMDPEIDHQLNVAHTFIQSIISGTHQLDSPQSVRAALNKAHGAKTIITKPICDQKGLRGCPNVSPMGFSGPQRTTTGTP